MSRAGTQCRRPRASSRSSGSRRSRCCCSRRSCSSATLPTWAERRHAATVAAREAARDLEQHWPAGNVAEADARRRSTSPPITGSAVRRRRCGCWPSASDPGDQIRVEVRVAMPAIAVPGLTAGRRVDLRRGRVVARRRLSEPVIAMPRRPAPDEHGMITLWILGLTVSVMFLGGIESRLLARDRSAARGVGDGRRRRDRGRERPRRARAAGERPRSSTSGARAPAGRGRAGGVSERRGG